MNFFKRFGLYKIKLRSLIFTSQVFPEVEVKRFFRKRKEYLAAKPQESDASKEKSNTTTVPSTMQVVKHCVVVVLNFKGQALKTHVLGSKPNMAKYHTQKRTEQSS